MLLVPCSWPLICCTSLPGSLQRLRTSARLRGAAQANVLTPARSMRIHYHKTNQHIPAAIPACYLSIDRACAPQHPTVSQYRLQTTSQQMLTKAHDLVRHCLPAAPWLPPGTPHGLFARHLTPSSPGEQLCSADNPAQPLCQALSSIKLSLQDRLVLLSQHHISTSASTLSPSTYGMYSWVASTEQLQSISLSGLRTLSPLTRQIAAPAIRQAPARLWCLSQCIAQVILNLLLRHLCRAAASLVSGSVKQWHRHPAAHSPRCTVLSANAGQALQACTSSQAKVL